MRKIFITLALVLSTVAVLLAMDLPRFAYKQIDAGGHSLRMFISGTGSPSVIFETGGAPGAGGPLECWERVQPAVSKFTLTVSYDRAGVALSAPGPKPRDARQVARELHTALQNAHVPPPYLLVGHSFGGPLNRVFADMYPTEVCGMVLADPTQEEAVAWGAARETNHVARSDDEWKEIEASLKEAHESHVPTNLPIILITAMGPRKLPDFFPEKEKKEFKEFKPAWLKFHSDWIKQFPNGRHLITENSGHVIPYEQPDLIIRSIREMVDQSSNHQR